jgi:hypothetical protein
MKKFSLISLTLLLALFSCDDDEPDDVVPAVDQLKVQMIPTFGTEDLQLDQTYITDEGYRVQFTDLKCYMTDLKNGSKTLATSALFDFREKGTLFLTKPGKPSDFSSMSAFLGVPADRNHADPTAFAESDPLYITNANDMHWGWNPGYIFIKVEAKVDTIDDAIDNFDHLVVFHVGGDDYLQNLNFGSLSWNAAGANLYATSLKLDMKTFLNNGSSSIDLMTEYSSHTAAGQEAISLKVIEHFRDAIGVY